MNPKHAEHDNNKLNLESLILFAMTGFLFSCATLTLWVVHLLSLRYQLGIAENWSWFLSRSTALVAYLLMTGSVAWGLVLSSKIAKNFTPPPLVMSIHNFISWLALTFAGLHAYLLLFDRYYTYRLSDILVPFVGPFKPVPVGLGVTAFWIFLAASASFSVKKQIGQKVWRTIHILTFPGFIAITLHGLLAGTDSGNLGMMLVYIACAGIVILLTLLRLFPLGLKVRAASVQS